MILSSSSALQMKYPGAACDVEAFSYMPLLEETDSMPSRRYAKGGEIRAHCNKIVDTYGLRSGILFQTAVDSAEWLEGSGRWAVTTDRGDRILAKYLVSSTGPLNKPKLANISGMDDFAGHCFHTSRWDYDYR